ncbi:hypothetical protein ACWEHA_04140 [Amycolatopsis nivea]
MIAFAAMLKKLYLRLPKQSMVRNAAILHVSQPALSQYLNLARVPPAPFLRTIYLTAAARTPEGELPCRLNELIELRRAAKGSLSHAGTRGQDTKNPVAHTTTRRGTAGKKDRRNGKSCRPEDRRNGNCVAPPEPGGSAIEGTWPVSSDPHSNVDDRKVPTSTTPALAAADMISAALASLQLRDYATVRELLEQAEPLLHRVTVAWV